MAPSNIGSSAVATRIPRNSCTIGPFCGSAASVNRSHAERAAPSVSGINGRRRKRRTLRCPLRKGAASATT